MCQAKRYRFRRIKIASDGSRLYEGVLPALERRLLTERGKIKKDLARVKDKLAASVDDTEKQNFEVSRNILDANQKALKVSANSAYGAMGARTGFMPLLIGAASVTAMGRKLINMAIGHIKSRYKTSRLVYGDSVTADTPLLIKYVGGTKDGLIDITTIENLFENPSGKQKPYPLFKPFDPNEERIHKEKTEFDGDQKFQVWAWGGRTGGGKWSNIIKVIRHKTNKKLYRVNTHTGCVDVTEDHSLLRLNGDKIKPSELKVGDKLLHSFPVFTTGEPDSFYNFKTNELSVPTSVAEKKAFIYGFFFGDGSCGRYACKSGIKWSWALNNQDLVLIRRLVEYLEDVYGDYFKYLNTLNSSGVYKIVPCGGDIKKYVQEYRPQFYDKNRLKKVPCCILNGDVNIRKTFMSGYYSADGFKQSKNNRFSNKGKIGSQGLYYMCKSLGYSCSIQIRKDKMDIYRVNSSYSYQRKDPIAIKKIVHLPSVTQDTFVYDIETDEGNFHCGIGEIMAKNTDSCMIRFEGADVAESFRLAHLAGRSATHYIKSSILGFPEDYKVDGKRLNGFDLAEVKLEAADNLAKLEYDSIPIDLEFEDMFGKYLLLTQKRYAGHVINVEGQKIKDVKKGIVLARRDNCAMLKTVYGRLLDAVLESSPEDAVLKILYDEIEKVYTRQIPEHQFIIYLAVNNVLSYAKTDSHGRFIGADGSLIIGVDGPLDSRLVYPNLRQVMLALRMLKRGDSIPAGTRLEFVFVKRPWALFEGDRLEDFDFYRENRKGPKRFCLRP